MSSMMSTAASLDVQQQLQNDPIIRPLIDLGMTQRDRPHHKNLPRASILLLLLRPRDEDEWHVLLTQRLQNLKSHPGQVCLPGGRQDKEDQGNDVVTALRETREEVGIPESQIHVIARMPSVVNVGGLCVTPVVGIWKSPVHPWQLSPNPDEVERVFYVPLSYFWDDANCSEEPYQIEWQGEPFMMRTYEWKDSSSSHNNNNKDPSKTFTIWGLTARILYDFADICNPSSSARTSQQSAPPRLRARL